MARTIFMLLTIFALNVFCNQSNPGTEKSTSTLKPRYLIFKTPSGFGYDIYVDDKRIIHQVHIPAVEGRLSFQTELQASSAAALVVSKLERGDFPPAVFLGELDSLGLLPDPLPN